jgi:hypothetical protein
MNLRWWSNSSGEFDCNEIVDVWWGSMSTERLMEDGVPTAHLLIDVHDQETESLMT